MSPETPRAARRFFLLWIGLISFAVFALPFLSLGEEATPGKIQFSFPSSQSTSDKNKTEDGSRWKQIETQHTVIRYNSSDDLEKFDRKIDFSPGEFSLKSLFSSSDSGNERKRFTEKIDALFERVQEILDMRKKSKKKVKIQLYSGKQELQEAYKALFGGELNVRAWYIFETNTIFINVNDVHEGMLAHEMAHSVIDHYLTVRPPRAAAEILAVYVDTHLFRKTKKYGRYE